ncbi:MAG TPA: hypothetical protein ENI23_17440 [bacterium]|nr:hypothetical protein [bacterium]
MKIASFVVSPKYALGEVVEYISKDYKPGQPLLGEVVAYSIYKSQHVRDECYSLTYIVVPNEELGYEESAGEERIPACHTTDLPYIVRKA